MSSVVKLSQELASLSQQLMQANHIGDTEEVYRIEERMADIQDELDDLQDFEDHHQFR